MMKLSKNSLNCGWTLQEINFLIIIQKKKKKKNSLRGAIPFNPHELTGQLNFYELSGALDPYELARHLNRWHPKQSATKLI